MISFYELNISKKVKYSHYSYFENWDPYKNYLFAKEKFGIEENPKQIPQLLQTLPKMIKVISYTHT